MKEHKITITLGAMAPPMSKQFKGMGFSKDLLRLWQRTNDSIAFLNVHGMMSDTSADASRGKLIAQIKRNLGRKDRT